MFHLGVRMKKLTGNRVFLLVSAAVLLAFVTQMSKIPEGAKEYPLFLLIASFLTVIALFVMPQQPEKTIGKENAIRIFLFACMTALSIFLLTKIGYILSTVLLVFAGLWYLKLKKNLVFYLFPIILTLSMYFLFTRGLSVILPMGSWFTLTL